MSRKPYPTDVSDIEWDLIKSTIPAERERKRGKKREVDMRSGGKCPTKVLTRQPSMGSREMPTWTMPTWTMLLCRTKRYSLVR